MNRARFLYVSGFAVLFMNLLLDMHGEILLIPPMCFIGAMIIQEIKEK